MLESDRSGEHRASTGACPQDGAMGFNTCAMGSWGMVSASPHRARKEGRDQQDTKVWLQT